MVHSLSDAGGRAAIVSALGDPDDEAVIDRLDAVYRSYCARRMTAGRERGWMSPVARFILVVVVGREREGLGPGRRGEQRRAHLGAGDHEFVERGEQMAILDGDRAVAFLGC